MIEVPIQKGLLSYREKWFFVAPEPSDAVRLVHYRQSRDDLLVPGFRRVPFETIVIELSKHNAELLKACRKTNQNEIRRAEREGVEFSTEARISDFVVFYMSCGNVFSINEERLNQYGNLLHLTSAICSGHTLAAHAYLLDKSISRARLLLSASRFVQAQTQNNKQFIGRAHRFLVYRDMLYFRDTGIRFLDLGGCAPTDRDRKLQNINAFKFGFGGKQVHESDYISYPLHLIRQLGHKLKGIPIAAEKE